MPDNLLQNPGFEEGADPFDPQGSVYVPKGWTFTFKEGAAGQRPHQTLPWGRPSAGCLSPAQFPQSEWPQFFEAGSQVLWKVWSGRSYPFDITLGQTVAVTPGAAYRFTLRVLPDMVTAYTPDGKTYATDPETAAVRLWARGAGLNAATEFLKLGPALPNGQYTTLTLEFTAGAGSAEVGLEAYGLFGIENLCFFVDNGALEQTAARPAFTRPATNLLVNGGFEEGRTYPADAAGQLAVPAGWLVEARAGQPAAQLLERRSAPPADRTRLFGPGDYAWRVAGAGSELRLWQAVSGLTLGQTCRAWAALYPDFPAGPGPAAAITVEMAGQATGTGWRGAADLPVNRFSQLEFTFTAGAPTVYVSVELRAGAAAGAWIVALIALEALAG